MAPYVHIHGAGSPLWPWHRVVPELQRRGYDVVTPDLPSDDDPAGLDVTFRRELTEKSIFAIGCLPGSRGAWQRNPWLTVKRRPLAT